MTWRWLGWVTPRRAYLPIPFRLEPALDQERESLGAKTMSHLSRVAVGLLLACSVLEPGSLGAQTVGYQMQLYPEYRLERFALPEVQSATVVGSVGQPELYALAHDPYSGELLTAGTGAQGIAFGRLDPENAAWTSLGPLSGIDGNVTGLATLGNDEPLYLVTWDGVGTRLYTIDRATGEGTLRSSFNARLFIDIAINDGGLLFAHCILTDAIYRIDSDGQQTLIGPTGLAADYAQGMDFDRSNGELYAWIYVADAGATSFSRINTETGAATVLYQLNGEYAGALTAPGSRLFRDGFEF